MSEQGKGKREKERKDGLRFFLPSSSPSSSSSLFYGFGLARRVGNGGIWWVYMAGQASEVTGEQHPPFRCGKKMFLKMFILRSRIKYQTNIWKLQNELLLAGKFRTLGRSSRRKRNEERGERRNNFERLAPNQPASQRRKKFFSFFRFGFQARFPGKGKKGKKFEKKERKMTSARDR